MGVLIRAGQLITANPMLIAGSRWSHAAIYIGDALLRWGGPHADEALARYGEEAATLLVESDMINGVTVRPLSKYQDRNIRICRPHGLPL